jgi:hypothetical protein
MADLIIKPSPGAGNKLILQDQTGGAILTTGDDGAVVVNADAGEITLIEKAAANASVATKGELWVKNTTPNTLFFTDDAGSEIGLGTDHSPSGTSITGNSLGVTAANDTAATLFIKADNSDDAGDDWTVVSNTNQTLTIENDIASAGTGVAMLTITPHATAASSTVAIAGGLTIGGGVVEKIGTGGITNATATIDLATGNFFVFDLEDTNADITTFTISNTNATANMLSSFIVKVIQGSTDREFTWGGLTAFKWPAATAPTLTTGNDKVDLLSFTTYDNGTTWYGQLVGQDFS